MVIDKLKKKKAGLGLRSFPIIGLDSFPTVSENVARAEELEEPAISYGNQDVPKVPNVFYNHLPVKQDPLMDEINKLNEVEFVDSKDEDISIYLRSLQHRIKADETWFAINYDSETRFKMIDSKAVSNNSLSASNELVSHAMGINHLMLIKNKKYIDGLMNNQADLSSLFIVPVNTDSAHGMLLAGYKTNRSVIDDIVVALDKSKSTLATFL